MATPSSPISVASRPSFACVRCAERKVRCTRQQPCRACVNHKVQCIFKPPALPQRRQKHVANQVLVDRLRYYETLLQEQGIDASKLPDTPQVNHGRELGQPMTEVAVSSSQHPQAALNLDSKPSGEVSKTQVIRKEGRSMFVENSLWSRVVEEFHNPEDTLEDCPSDANEASDNDLSFVLNSDLSSKSRPRHPPSDMILQLWDTFVETVDPLTKLVHVPTMRPAIQKAANNLEAIPRSLEALMFAIYGAAVLSLDENDCQNSFGESRKTLLSRYINATKTALSRARFMETTTLVVLQALTLHLVSVRDIYEPRAVWSLTGVAIRIAQGMGLERDGTFLGLPPFDTEMRRRLWWLLKTHDHRTAELCGLSKFRDLDMSPESTKRPTNVNDDQLFPGMTDLPAESKTLSDSAFIALRYELVSFASSRVAKFRQEGKSLSQWDRDLASGSNYANKESSLNELEEQLGMNYLRHCDPSQPLHLLTMLMARAAINTIKFLTHHPRRWASLQQTPLSERQWVWDISINLLEQYSMLHSNPLLKRFAWHVAYVMQWHVLIHVLDSLRANPMMADAEKAWRLVESTFTGYPAMAIDMGKAIHVAVGSLCLKAYSARETALLRDNRRLPPTPQFIVRLRKQHEVARPKGQARDAKNRETDDGDVGHVSVARQAAVIHGGGLAQIDPFSYILGQEDTQTGSFNDLMDLDLDFMLAQGLDVENGASYTINWEQ